jgi:hypothetical protein
MWKFLTRPVAWTWSLNVSRTWTLFRLLLWIETIQADVWLNETIVNACMAMSKNVLNNAISNWDGADQSGGWTDNTGIKFKRGRKHDRLRTLKKKSKDVRLFGTKSIKIVCFSNHSTAKSVVDGASADKSRASEQNSDAGETRRACEPIHRVSSQTWQDCRKGVVVEVMNRKEDCKQSLDESEESDNSTSQSEKSEREKRPSIRTRTSTRVRISSREQ